MQMKIACLCLSVFFMQEAYSSAPALENAKKTLEAMQQMSCPTPGRLLLLRGLETPKSTSNMIATNWDFAQSSISKVNDAIRKRNDWLRGRTNSGGKLRRKDRTALSSLDNSINESVAKVSIALANWAFAQLVELSRIDPRYDSSSGTAHPLTPFIDDLTSVNSLTSTLDSDFDTPIQLTPVGEKLGICMLHAQNVVIKSSAESLMQRAKNATVSQEVTRLIADYQPMDNPGGASKAPAVLQDLGERRQQLQALENMAAAEREKARQKQQQELAALQQKEREQRLRVKRANAQQGLPVATQLVNALASGSVSRMAPFLSQDVVMYAPQTNPIRGKSNVLDRFSQASSGASLSAPTINSNADIVSIVHSSQYGRLSLYIDVRNELVTMLRMTQ